MIGLTAALLFVFLRIRVQLNLHFHHHHHHHHHPLASLPRAWARKHQKYNCPDRVPPVFSSYQRRGRERYQSTLTVTLGPQKTPKKPEGVARRAFSPLEVETYPISMEQVRAARVFHGNLPLVLLLCLC